MNLKPIIGVFCCLLFFNACKKEKSSTYPNRIIELEASKAADLAAKMQAETNVEVSEDFKLSLWATDSLIADPIAISVAPDGRIFYTSATRQSNSEFDIRGHRNWMTASISFQTVEDRREFLRKTFKADGEESQKFLKDLNKDDVLDWRDLTVEKEQVWFVEDQSGDGIADRAQLYLEDYGEEITDVANGVEFHDGEVYIAVGPDLWRTKDTDGDGIANTSESLSHGYAVHIGFSGHGMSGAIMGPDGRIWWGIGDIGANVIDKDGKQWKYPNRGVIARCEPDGSNFEIFCMGVRNTHEFVFDQYGNLISEDNDGDHSGERERLVYLINGSDTGWRINWQFGKYTDPDNNTYKVWMDEKMHVPHWEGQAAYFLPPIMNYVNGPTGFVYNPGTALSEKYYNHFFVAEFRGTAARSPIHAFTLKSKGASFELDKTEEIVKGLLPTGLDFGADGALYFGDWIEGWGTKDAGRIWKLDVPNGENSKIRLETKQLLQADFKEKSLKDLGNLLGHQDMRVRQKAQFELVKRGDDGFIILEQAVQSNDNQLAKIHGLWGMAQMARQHNMKYAPRLIPFVKNSDDEVAAQAAKMLGDINYKEADGGQVVTELLKNPSLRVQMLATEALGRMQYLPAFESIIEVLEKNNDEDKWLRHAGAIALSRIADAKKLISEYKNPSVAVRTAIVVALRRQSAPIIGEFLKDDNEFIVTEAARAINDDFSIEEALSDLANILNTTPFQNEALIRRAINANLRVGKAENIQQLADYAKNKNAPAPMRAEALAALSTWGKPSVFDRVDGRYRGEITRDETPAKTIIQPILSQLLQQETAIQIAAAQAAARFQLNDENAILLALVKNSKAPEVRKASLEALKSLKADKLDEALEIALADKDPAVRSTALELLPSSSIAENKLEALFDDVLNNGTIQEKQSVLAALAQLKTDAAVQTLSKMMTKLSEDKVEAAIQLDIIESIEEQGNESNLAALKAYKDAKPKNDELAQFRETLAGGTPWKGRNIFYYNETAQCIRCHAVFEVGGNAGPGLAGVGSRLSREDLLASMITPSSAYATGYEVVSLELQNGTSLAGIVSSENDQELILKIGKEDVQTISKSDIKTRKSIPSSMPSMKATLTKKEIRDLVAFLASLEEKEL
jgi:putative heme-binding domain-containing protein